MHQVLFVLLILLCVDVSCDIELDKIIGHGTPINTEQHCKDIDETCQELALNGYCYDTDFIRYFCPISCRNPLCTNYFPAFTSKSNYWTQMTSTICYYPSSTSSKLYFYQINNVSLNQCQHQCNNNPLCSHLLYIEKSILAQQPITDYIQFLLLTTTNKQIHNDIYDDNMTINICIHSYIPLKSCQPICVNNDLLLTYLINHKQDPNTHTNTAKLLKPFIFSAHYQYISLFSLYMNEHQSWHILNEFNTKNSIIPYESHEYYYPQMDVNNNGLRLLRAPKLSTFAGVNKVRLEFESRVDRALEVSWVNTRNRREYFQESLEADTWSITKARHSFDGHIFVIRDSQTKEWLTTYRNNPSHTNVFITITPFGVCVRDETQQNNNGINMDTIPTANLLKQAQQKRWGAHSNISEVWSLYEQILWSSNHRKMRGKVLNLMGQIFLFGSYDEIFDFDLAWSYFKVAAMMNDGDAMYNMAFMIEKKFLPTTMYSHLPKNLYRISMLNYWCAAQSHSQKAQLLLGFRYLNGIGMNKSCEHSVFFYQKLAKKVRNDARSLDKYVDVIDLSDPISNVQDLNMNEHQIRYYQQYAAMGRAWAHNHLGQVYLFGLRGIAQNYETAAQHFEAAANAKDPVAANYLGRLYWNGLGRKRNLNKTLELFAFAAQRNVSQAQNNLAYMLWKGIGCQRNTTKALKWFKRAASLNFAQAMFYLGEIYKKGDGVGKNISMAVEYYILATKRRHYRSMYELAMLYKDGIGVAQDCEKAVALFKYVAEYHNVKFELENARSSFESSRYAESFVIYAQKAEEGYINGQINAAFLADNGYHKYLYDIDGNPFYTVGDVVGEEYNKSKTKKIIVYDDVDGECKNNVFYYSFDDNALHEKYKHKVSIPENKELAFRFYSFAASQNHSRSLRILGDYYWYEWPPINLFSYLANISFDIDNNEHQFNKNNNSQSIGEYDQRSMALSIAYLSTPQSIVKYSNIEKDANQNNYKNTIKVNHSEPHSVEQVMKNEYLLRHEVIACYLYELASLQMSPKVDGQSLYDFAYCYEHGKGKGKNISKAREIYWNAMNKSTQAFIPVFVTLLKMEVINLYHLSTNELCIHSMQQMENVILVISVVMLVIVLCIKSRRNTNSRRILDPNI